MLPAGVLESLDGFLAKSKRAKFFSETDGDKKSFEVKLKFESKWYSIEYSEDGTLEDIEVVISFDSLDESLKNSILKQFNTYNKFHIDRIQRQFSSSQKSNRTVIEDALNADTADLIRYELEVSLKQDGEWRAYEMLFSNTGELIQTREIIHRSTDFILYR